MRDAPVSRRAVFRGAVLLGTGGLLTGAAPAFATPRPAAVPDPGIAGCDVWGARAVSGLTDIGTGPNKILVHHTETANQTDVSRDAAYRLARSIQDWHMDHNGWLDTGQHFTISRGGHAMEGRHHSLAHLTSGSGMVVGAHCPGQNDEAIGIENEGTYFTVAPPDALWAKLVNLCAHICDRYGIAPTEIYGHRDYTDTDCPGDRLYGMLPGLRAQVADVLGGGEPPVFQTVVDNTDAGFAASGSWGVSAWSAGRYGADYRYADPAPVADAAYYSADLPAAGDYRVEVWYPDDPGYNAATPFVVFTASGPTTVTVDQRTGGGRWTDLGTHAFSAGARDVLAVSRWSGASGYVIADAVRVTAV